MINIIKIIKKIMIINFMIMMSHLDSQNCRLKFSLEFCCVPKLWVLSANKRLLWWSSRWSAWYDDADDHYHLIIIIDEMVSKTNFGVYLQLWSSKHKTMSGSDWWSAWWWWADHHYEKPVEGWYDGIWWEEEAPVGGDHQLQRCHLLLTLRHLLYI